VLIRRYLLVLLVAPLLLLILLVVVNAVTSNPMSVINIGRIIFPYSLFCLVILWWSKGKTPGAVRRVIYRLPLVFLTFETLYLMAEKYLDLPQSLSYVGLTAVMITLAIFVVVLGYIYIFLAEIGYIALVQAHRFDQFKNTDRKMSLHC